MISNNDEIEIVSKLVEIIYLDHVLYRNLSSTKIKPSLRKTIGWITKQNEDAIWLTWDKSLCDNENESDDHASGLVILRNTIKEMIEL
jgi:hypothetical protein